MIGVVHQTLFLCPCCSGQTGVLPGYIAHYCLQANDHYNRDIAITFPAQLLSFKLPSPYLTGCYNFGVSRRAPVLLCMCFSDVGKAAVCVPSYQIMPFISVLRMFQHFDSLFTLPRVKALSMFLIAFSLTCLLSQYNSRSNSFDRKIQHIVVKIHIRQWCVCAPHD